MDGQRDLFTKRVRKAKAPTEFAVHVTITDLLSRPNVLAPGWMWTHPPNGEARAHDFKMGADGRWHRVSFTGAKLKRMGVRPGTPDLLLWSPTGLGHFLEF